MAMPSTAIARTEYGVRFQEFDLTASRAGFIGPSVLRPWLAGQQAADVPMVPLAALLQKRPNIKRAPRGGYARFDFEFGKFDYKCIERGVEEPIDDATLAIFADVIDAEAIHSQRAIDGVLRDYEIDVATALYNTAVWTEASGLQTAIVNEWDDSANCTPIADISAARRVIWERCGFYPNTLVVNRRQFDALSESNELIDRVIYGGGPREPALVTRQALASILGLDQVLVAESAQNTANPGAAANIDQIWSDEYAMLCRVAKTPDPAEVCIGRTILWPGDGASGFNDKEIAVLVEEYREEGRRGSVIRARTYWDLVVTLPEAGQLLSNVITLP